VLDAPEEIYAPDLAAPRRRPRRTEPEPRPDSGRDFDDDFADGLPEAVEEAGYNARRQRGGVRFRFNGRPVRFPKTLRGKIFGGIGFLVFASIVVATLIAVRSFFLHDPRFVIESSSSIESVGNANVTRAQLLSVFGGDVERNIFNVPLAERRAELEQLPWVEHATVMRLLPNHLRILITERTPVAFVRQGSQIGMVDANGVLLDMPTDGEGAARYSFPVVTGIAASDPLSTRAARMKLFTQFSSDLDSSGEHISQKLSEVDLSSPEDVKALIPEGQTDVLVHFGDASFLDRYRKFEQHLGEWRAQYPKLSSVDMRYDRQVVLDMQPGSEAAAQQAASPQASESATQQGTKSAAPQTGKPSSQQVSKAAAAPANAVAMKPAGKSVAPHAAKPVPRPAGKAPAKAVKKTAKPAADQWHMVVVKPHTKAAAALGAKAKPAYSAQASPQ
jgi:cell division protein FtsQ